MTDENADPVFEWGDVVDGGDLITDRDAAQRAFVETTPAHMHRDHRRATVRATWQTS